MTSTGALSNGISSALDHATNKRLIITSSRDARNGTKAQAADGGSCYSLHAVPTQYPRTLLVRPCQPLHCAVFAKLRQTSQCTAAGGPPITSRSLTTTYQAFLAIVPCFLARFLHFSAHSQSEAERPHIRVSLSVHIFQRSHAYTYLSAPSYRRVLVPVHSITRMMVIAPCYDL